MEPDTLPELADFARDAGVTLVPEPTPANGNLVAPATTLLRMMRAPGEISLISTWPTPGGQR